jgi:hypothetical protein
MATLEGLAKGHYQRAAELTIAAGDDAALALYLMKNDQMLVLRDLLGHTSVLSTELYIARLDVSRIYRDAYRDSVARMAGAPAATATVAEVEAEFDAEHF